MKAEVGKFLYDSEQELLDEEMKDVYVTDHKPVTKKFITLSDEEDLEYYNYVKNLDSYNAKASMTTQRIHRFNSGRYELGSLKQRIFEPYAGAYKLDNGTMFLEFDEKSMGKDLDETELRATYEHVKNITPLEGEDEAEIRAAYFDALSENERVI